VLDAGDAADVLDLVREEHAPASHLVGTEPGVTVEFRSLPVIIDYDRLLQDARQAFKGSWSRLQAEAESEWPR